MTKHIRITVEADDLPEPLVYEADAESYRLDMDSDFAKIEYDGALYYARAGGTLRIDWRINPVWDFSK